jgi:hypothetical protein
MLSVLAVSVFGREQILFKKIISQTNLGTYGYIQQVVDNQKTYDSLCQTIEINNSSYPIDFNKSNLFMIGYPQTAESFNQKIWTMFNDDSIITINLYFDTMSISSSILPAQGYKIEIVEFPIQNQKKYIIISYITNRTNILPINRNSISTPVYFKYKCDALGRRYNNSFIKNNRYYSIIKEVK